MVYIENNYQLQLLKLPPPSDRQSNEADLLPVQITPSD